jgi:hypothetical protein
MPEIGGEVLLGESRGDNPNTRRGLFDFIAKAFSSGNKKLTVAEVLCGHHQLLYNIVLELSGKKKEVAMLLQGGRCCFKDSHHLVGSRKSML